MKNKHITAYQTATTFIGGEYAQVVKDNPRYQKTPNQKRQPLQLYAGGTEVIITDINIFKYYRQTVKSEVDINQEVVYHNIFLGSDNVKTNYPVFTDRQVRDDFEAGLKVLYDTGKYDQIISKYIID